MKKVANPIKFERELFKMSDGGTIAIDWVDQIPSPGGDGRNKRPIVAVMPGLSSNNDEVYVLNLLIEAKRQGYRPVVINYRGASDVALTSAKLYCAGSVDDLRQPLKYLHEKYCRLGGGGGGDRPTDLYLIGNSMGANITANFVGEEGSSCFLKAVCCVQPPMKMWECGENIKTNNYGFYNYALGRNLKVKFEKYVPHIQEAYMVNHGIDLPETLRKSRHLIDIDTHMTSVSFGYGDLKTYYDKASCIHRIPKIKTPTLFLMAEDDPIIGDKAICAKTCEENPYVLLGLTKQGGHLGYFEKLYSTQQWFTEPVFEFLK